ncbi:anti-sigma factor [Paucibacter sp. APW11]|uniref:Anti-sigma factor n=1 Tax=Roseateles aquae TaxID=3077235 RepID=A0ABU3PDS1_9BURK|nr:anti-sigma factor [Paucibacter sp. APW11]MDT9000283.1 anti-sigma factor [Paucibacter sp. APW11]
MTHLNFDDATLHAYVDGQLSAYEAAEVTHWLQSHPEQAARVLEWRSQRAALQGLKAQMLDEPVPAALLQALRPAAARSRRQDLAPWQQALAAALLLGLGLGLGWGAHDWHDSQGNQAKAGQQQATAPEFVRDAAIAHVVYQAERRHPVEVGADQQEHLVQWLSKRLAQPLRVPDLRDQGYRLVGGRLLPAGDSSGPAAAESTLARAQFMFENEAGERLTLYISTSGPTQAAPARFRLTEHSEGGRTMRSFYWLDGQLGYALSGPLDAGRLNELGSLVYARLKAEKG